MKIIPWIILIIFVLLEGTLTTIPLTINVLIVFYVITKRNFIFGLASILGIFLDFLLVRTIGVSSLIFLFFLFLIVLYERKFEIQTTQFIFIFSLLTTSIVSILFQHTFLVLQIIFTSFVTTLIFIVIHRSFKTTSILS